MNQFNSNDNVHALFIACKKMIKDRLPEKEVTDKELQDVLIHSMHSFSNVKNDNMKEFNKKTLLHVLNALSIEIEENLEDTLVKFEQMRNAPVSNMNEFIEPDKDVINPVEKHNINITLPKQEHIQRYNRTFLISSILRNWEIDKDRHFITSNPPPNVVIYLSQIVLGKGLIQSFKNFTIIKLNVMDDNGKLCSYHLTPFNEQIWKPVHDSEPIIIKNSWTLMLFDEFDEQLDLGSDNIKINKIHSFNKEFTIDYDKKDLSQSDLLIRTNKNKIYKMKSNGHNRYKSNELLQFNEKDFENAVCLESNKQWSALFYYII
jgi:hypothetical protein